MKKTKGLPTGKAELAGASPPDAKQILAIPPTFAGSAKVPHKVWSGVLTFGLISMPVVLFTAASEERISFHQLHDACEGRIKLQLFCPACDVVVPKEKLLKGYEYQKGQYVIVSEDELDGAEPKSAKVLELSAFVPASHLDPIFFESSYYLAPQDGGQTPFAIVLAAMRDTHLVGVARIVRNSKEHICVIRPYGQGMILHTLFWNTEVRAMAFPAIPEPSEAQVGVAKQVIQMLTAEWDPSEYRDHYRDAVLQLIADKQHGKEIVASSSPTTELTNVVDISTALEKSLAALREKKGAA